MSSALLHGLPVLVVVALIVLIYRRTGKQPAPYRLTQPWTHEPILWSATAEAIPVDRHAHGESVLGVGGGASGRW